MVLTEWATGSDVDVDTESERVFDDDVGDEYAHYAWEDDPDKALCGKDLTGWPYDIGPGDACEMCVVCVELERAMNGS